MIVYAFAFEITFRCLLFGILSIWNSAALTVSGLEGHFVFVSASAIDFNGFLNAADKSVVVQDGRCEIDDLLHTNPFTVTVSSLVVQGVYRY